MTENPELNGGKDVENITSRIIIKNLPGYLSEKRLKDHISSLGCSITDVKIVKRKSEKDSGSEISRKFGFVGFFSEKDAKRAIDYFNGTFIDTCRISVQYAFPPGSEHLPRPWSKYSVGSSQYSKRNLSDNSEFRPENGGNSCIDSDSFKNENKKKNEENEEKENFKKWILRKKSEKSWLDSAEQSLEDYKKNDDNSGKKVAVKTVKPTKAGVSSTRKHVQFYDSEDEKGEKEDELKINEDSSTDDEDVNSSSYSDSNCELEEKHNFCEEVATSPTETSRLMVVNISYSTSEDDLRELFSKWGEIKEVSIIRSSDTGVSKGYGFVQYEFPEHAIKAISSSHLTYLQGRLLRVYPAFNKPIRNLSNILEENKVVVHSNNYKIKSLKKKKEASKNSKTWNLLYVSGNSAVDSFIKSENNTEKHDIIDVESSNLASRVSIIETHVISATKEWLKKEGISVESFEVQGDDIFSAKFKFNKNDEEKYGTTIRSKDTIIIKHLPSEHVTISELQKICTPFGQLNRLCLNPSKTIAIVQYLEESSAKSAFKRISFKRFKGVPLYVEWAPINIFVSEKGKQINKDQESEYEKVDGKIKTDDTEQNDDANNITHIFIKNLNFSTNDSSLERVFGKFKGFRKATISTKSSSDSNGRIVKKSMGYGFLEFNTKENAKDCIKKMQSVVVDGHTLELKISKSSQKISNNINSDSSTFSLYKRGVLMNSTSNKLLIKNLPFQATKSDITALFSSVGTVTAVRVPKKSDGTNKGYCFVEFLGKLEAISAYEQFKNSHLYGRHLVIEIAKDDETSPNKRIKTCDLPMKS
ncbi:RNA-binding domain [Cryptosporidium bovis]|uniref:RNA-binding domain n=1 Tax=Cryptosporidium bovis TaxID=310047 RepID=UPI00351A6B6E|nr:RNA-binding domain [Cryptosporidium bovis]